MDSIKQNLNSDNNRNKLLTLINDIVGKKYQITLNNDFSKIFNDIMDTVSVNLDKNLMA